MKDVIKAVDKYRSSLIGRGTVNEELGLGFSFLVECFDKDGNLKWSDTFHNTVVTEGKNSVLDIYFDAATQITTWYLGLKGTGTVDAGDTLASHAGWSEITDYTGNRAAITFGEPSAGSLAASSAVSFAITGTATVAGAFVASVATGTSGVLFSAGNFTEGNRSVINGDTLNVTPTIAFS
jgi:hypothetical protein